MSGERLENMNDMVEVSVKTIGPSPPSRILIPSPITIRDLRILIAEKKNLPIENLRIIFCGNVLDDSSSKDQEQILLNSNDSLIVAVRPKPPAQHLQEGLDFDDDDVKFQLPQSTSQLKRRLYSFMHDKLKLPDMLLMAIFSLSLKIWAIIILWFILAPIAHRWNLGPLYILGTGFTIIFLNLGRRQAGDLSAYSIFNEDFRELPGTLNADRLDRDIRAGQF